jgi:hypothetical protein
MMMPLLLDGAAFIHRMTEREVTDAIRVTGEAKFAQAMEWSQEIRFVNLVVDVGTVNSFKTVVCLFASPHSAILPVLRLLHENKNLNADDDGALLIQLFAILDGSPIIICAVIIDNLSAQSQGLDRIPDQSPMCMMIMTCDTTVFQLDNTNIHDNQHPILSPSCHSEPSVTACGFGRCISRSS